MNSRTTHTPTANAADEEAIRAILRRQTLRSSLFEWAQWERRRHQRQWSPETPFVTRVSLDGLPAANVGKFTVSPSCDAPSLEIPFHGRAAHIRVVRKKSIRMPGHWLRLSAGRYPSQLRQ
jgi:hypothetical protein